MPPKPKSHQGLADDLHMDMSDPFTRMFVAALYWRAVHEATECELPECQHRLCACGHAECGHADENVQPNCSDCRCAGFREQST